MKRKHSSRLVFVVFAFSIVVLGALSCGGGNSPRRPLPWEYDQTQSPPNRDDQNPPPDEQEPPPDNEPPSGPAFSFFVNAYDRVSWIPEEVSSIEVTANVTFSYAVEVSSMDVNWGDGRGWQKLELPEGENGFFNAQKGTVCSLSHFYTAEGDYQIDLKVLDGQGRVLTIEELPISIHVGPRIRPFTDAEGLEQDIMDGIVIVYFRKSADYYLGLDHSMSKEPDIAEFIRGERVLFFSEWRTVSAIGVFLPPSLSVEEAISEWPDIYPELILTVEPDYLSEPA